MGPITHGSAVHTDIMKTQALKQALDKHQFDVAFGGARRDEENLGPKKLFSFRSKQHRWDPKNQRPELWSFIIPRKTRRSIRVFPLSNWTGLIFGSTLPWKTFPLFPCIWPKSGR